MSHSIAKYKSVPSKQRAIFTAAILFNLLALIYFKYANFFVAEFNVLLQNFNIAPVNWVQIALPIGISFITFHKISYLIDIYRGVVNPAKNFINYTLYIALFPQLIAGPIIRYHDINREIEKRTHSASDIFDGIYRFTIGLSKKALLADPMGKVANNVLALDATEFTQSYALLGIIAYAYQIYFDFSGYSDMAIGLGRIFGFHFLENFNSPYIAKNFTDFWRRWHISLSRWMKDYLYIPLGGNRCSPIRTYFNLWIVFLLSGLWHGASMTFIVWGAYHGLFLALDKLFWLQFSKRLGALINTILTFILVLVGWVFFRCETLTEAFHYLSVMSGISSRTISNYAPRATIIHNYGVVAFSIATFISFAPAFPQILNRITNFALKIPPLPKIALRFAFCVIFLTYSVISIAASNYSPFIYFKF